MKKIFAIVLSALLCLSLFMVAGCGSAFDADYKETDAAAVSQIVTKATEAEEGTKIDYSAGVKVYMDIDMNMTAGGKTESVKINSSMYFKAANDNAAMYGEVKGEGQGENLNAKVYYSDGYLYTNGTSEGKTVKTKQAISIESVIAEFDMTRSTTLMDIRAAFASVANIEGVKYYTAEKDGNTYIKFTFESAEMGKGEMYFIFNADFNLIGFKMQSSGKMELDGGSMESKMLISMEPYSGSINLPSDLDTYEEGEFDN